MPKAPVDLKAYYRDLVTACGGPKRAAEIVGGHASHICEAMATHNLERWPRLDHVALMEADCGLPIVTRAMADRVGFALEASQPAASGMSLIEHLSSVMTESADVTKVIIAAAQDGRLTEAERRDARRQVQEAIAALVKLDGCIADSDAALPTNIARFGK